MQDQVVHVVKDLNRFGCIDKVRSGLWRICTEWLLGPEMDESSFRLRLMNFLNQESEEMNYPRRVHDQLEVELSESAVAMEELAPTGRSRVREAVER